MASIRVPVVDFVDGVLPEVCVRSGVLAANRYPLVARGGSGKPVIGAIPLHSSVARRISTWRALAIWFLVGGLGSLVGAVALRSGGALGGAIAALVIMAGALIVARRSGVQAKVVENGFIELSPASDGFRLAVMVPPSKCGDGCGCSSHQKDACADDDALTH